MWKIPGEQGSFSFNQERTLLTQLSLNAFSVIPLSVVNSCWEGCAHKRPEHLSQGGHPRSLILLCQIFSETSWILSRWEECSFSLGYRGKEMWTNSTCWLLVAQGLDRCPSVIGSASSPVWALLSGEQQRTSPVTQVTQTFFPAWCSSEQTASSS